MNCLSFRTPLRFLRGSWVRLGLTVVALACGVALVCGIDLISRAVFTAFVEVIDTMAGRAALQVQAGEGGVFSEEVATTVGRVPGVDLAVPVVSATAFTADYTGELLTVHGVDIGQDAAVRLYESQDERGLELNDPLAFLNQPDSVALTRTFMTRRGLDVGDPIDLDTPMGRRRFIVRGALEPQGVARVYGGNLVVMDLYAAEEAFTRPRFINRIDVALVHNADVAQVAGAIAAVLPAGLHVEAPEQRKADLNKGMQAFELLLRAVGILGLGAAMLIAFNRVATVFEANVWQLGTLQAVGVAPVAVWWELVKQALLLGVAGTLLGIPLGIAVGWLALPILARAMALAYNLTTPEAALHISPASIVLAASTGVGAAVLAAIVPAWRATKLGITTTLRSRGLEQPATMTRAMWLIRGLVAAGIVLAIALQSVSRSPAWGLLATGLIAAATVLAARPLLALAGSPLRHALTRLAGPVARFVADVILHNARRSSLTAAMLGVGLATVLWLWMLGRSFEQSVIETLTGVVRAELVVSSANVASGFVEAPIGNALIHDLQRVTGVLAAAGERVIDWEYGGGPITINALDESYFLDPQFGQWPLFGHHDPDVWQAVARGDAVIGSSNFMLHLGTRVGETITLETPSGPQPLRVAGVTLDFASARGTLEISRTLYERLWHDSHVTRVFVRTQPETPASTVSAAIAHALGAKYRIRILSAGEMVEYFASQVRHAFASVYVLAGMVLVVVLVGMADTLAGGVADRTRELGVIRAVGVEAPFLRRMVLAEALMLGVLGVVLAVAAGLGMGTLWVKWTFPYLFGWVLRPHVPYVPMFVVTVLTIAVCVFAALVPAARAARVDPVLALRYE